MPSTSFPRKKPNQLLLLVEKECPLCRNELRFVRIEAISKPASDLVKTYELRSLRGAKARTAYIFLDFYSNYWSGAGRFIGEHAFTLGRSRCCPRQRIGRCSWMRSVPGGTEPTQVRFALLHDFELEVELFAAEDCRQIEFPKLSREAEGRPALIEVDYELESQRAPQICEAHVRLQWLELSSRVERKRRARRNKAS